MQEDVMSGKLTGILKDGLVAARIFQLAPGTHVWVLFSMFLFISC
jgi:hypothetical protein